MPNTLMDAVIALEWEMFTTVRNSGRRADCQEDPEAFRAMRLSQLSEWPEPLLSGYRGDLESARLEGRNLMTEKYAWMMESTFPEEFANISEMLPPIGAETAQEIEEIIAVNVEWKIAVCGRYPKLGQKGRPVRSGEDSRFDTSFETYLRGELKTYSPATVKALHAFTMRRKNEGVNGVERDLTHQMRWYGFASLEQAEAGQ